MSFLRRTRYLTGWAVDRRSTRFQMKNEIIKSFGGRVDDQLSELGCCCFHTIHPLTKSCCNVLYFLIGPNCASGNLWVFGRFPGISHRLGDNGWDWGRANRAEIPLSRWEGYSLSERFRPLVLASRTRRRLCVVSVPVRQDQITIWLAVREPSRPIRSDPSLKNTPENIAPSKNNINSLQHTTKNAIKWETTLKRNKILFYVNNQRGDERMAGSLLFRFA